ncbi:trypsin-like peptidase domain-containing protein [Flavobacterium sp. Fl-77]|uniref:Trypsin-like peptidase domain-containing protein n=1 Tax=Flavobacterium flavipigmentatum TaxID=2893884 RepID=A0AAJ2SCC2_9FLAO|nr:MULTISPECIES: trypsin-like peptidase domain-containing protein [unclassified Flavobacterium]MDX6183245.1 trypsin-like peptidase domain-containing protein [Flavobacterium sp. Fl-33]MDX6186529.1 trypsin-like peptidase domain-containing protein [Flavobacterium sp. Fl-77]UFH38701.1 trypsin-like peptidase domain-containing protein [Flavobacterium sp. F-70]
MKRFSTLFLVSLLSGATTLGAYKLLFESNGSVFGKGNSVVTLASESYNKNVAYAGEAVDFTEAADKTVHSVVHVKNVSRRTVTNPMLEFFYGYGGAQQQEQVGTGSGVIISEDGYIVTNNHVIKDASEIEITLNNKKTYTAKLIGTDSKMDIALLKINSEEKLPYTAFANSDNVKVGEWVLAVGNPYNLNSTVTAGIVSAKARDLGNGIQSFIQTDAAVNPGNSGGALVNTRGELIGINTMISSQTGSYVGYSFAVPSNNARKIIEDIMEFGNVQRGILGVEGRELNGNASKELKISETEGFYINKVSKNSGAEKAGLKQGDVIVKLDSQRIASYADLSGYINTKRPNDVVNVTIIRDANTKVVPVTLSKNEFFSAEFKGIELENIDASDKKKFRIDYGVKIKNITNENLMQYQNELLGNIILSIDNVKATNVESVSKLLKQKDEGQSVRIEMINRNGEIFRIII